MRQRRQRRRLVPGRREQEIEAAAAGAQRGRRGEERAAELHARVVRAWARVLALRGSCSLLHSPRASQSAQDLGVSSLGGAAHHAQTRRSHACRGEGEAERHDRDEAESSEEGSACEEGGSGEGCAGDEGVGEESSSTSKEGSTSKGDREGGAGKGAGEEGVREKASSAGEEGAARRRAAVAPRRRATILRPALPPGALHLGRGDLARLPVGPADAGVQLLRRGALPHLEARRRRRHGVVPPDAADVESRRQGPRRDARQGAVREPRAAAGAAAARGLELQGRRRPGDVAPGLRRLAGPRRARRRATAANSTSATARSSRPTTARPPTSGSPRSASACARRGRSSPRARVGRCRSGESASQV